MTALAFIVALTLSILVAPLASKALPPTKVHRIGHLSLGHPPSGPTPSLDAFRQGLRGLGYVEGQNLVIESRYAEGREERLPDLAAELVRLKVEVIVVGGVAAIHAAQRATRTIPIVMPGTYDPVGQGFVAGLAQPGGNITGLSWLGGELPGKRLELLKETVPQSRRIAVLANPAFAAYGEWMHILTAAAQALGLQLHVLELHRADELDSAFAAMTREGVDALLVLSDPALMDGLRGRVADLAAKLRLPAMYDWRMYVDAGGLMSYGPSMPALQRRAAAYVDKILQGAKPADLPVEQPTKFALVINLKTAKALGITIPPSVLFQADEVIR
ncbi:MAG: transporter substrate-binding protein [Dehalococcoidia bacterium]|nr:transporter substrate-binding protein [Dehalococcoidia bacterium]